MAFDRPCLRGSIGPAQHGTFTASSTYDDGCAGGNSERLGGTGVGEGVGDLDVGIGRDGRKSIVNISAAAAGDCCGDFGNGQFAKDLCVVATRADFGGESEVVANGKCADRWSADKAEAACAGLDGELRERKRRTGAGRD